MAIVMVDTETGEIVNEVYKGDRVIRKASIDHLKKPKEELPEDQTKWEMEQFYKGSIKELKLVSKQLTNAEVGFLFRVIPYISYIDCCIKHPNGKPIAIKGLTGITNTSRQSVSKTINSLVSKDILYKGRNSKEFQYYVNPWLFVRGNITNKILKNMFRNYYIHTKGKKWKDL